jgi:hypothetical protein
MVAGFDLILTVSSMVLTTSIVLFLPLLITLFLLYGVHAVNKLIAKARCFAFHKEIEGRVARFLDQDARDNKERNFKVNLGPLALWVEVRVKKNKFSVMVEKSEGLRRGSLDYRQ